jgi:hypothetical protein
LARPVQRKRTTYPLVTRYGFPGATTDSVTGTWRGNRTAPVGGLHHRYERRAAWIALTRDRLPLHLLAWKNLRLWLSVAGAVT